MGRWNPASVRVSGLGAALCVALALPAPRRPCESLSREDSVRAIDRSDHIAVEPLDRFEKTWTIEDGRRALAKAREARDLLEVHCVASGLESARREELVFFNHVILGLDAWLARANRPDARKELGSILKRGRAHRERSREALGGTREAETTRKR